jgi:hypothetical protein
MLLFLSKTPKTVCIPSLITKHHHPPPFSELYHLHQYTMKFKSDSTPSKKTTSDQQNKDTFDPKRIEPLTTVTPTVTKKKNTHKSATKKKKSSKKGELKNDRDISETTTSAQEVKKTKGKEALKDSSDVSTHVPDVGRKLGLEYLNDAIDSAENMDIDASNDTNANDSVGEEPDETDVRKDDGPEVETSLGQPSNSVDVTTTGGNKDPIFETAPEMDSISDKSVENSISEEGKKYEEVSKETKEEDDFMDKEKDKDVVDVGELDLDDIPLANTFGDGVAKRLRRNKGIIVPPTRTIPKKMTTSAT